MALHWMSWSAAKAATPTRGTITTTRATTIISLRLSTSPLPSLGRDRGRPLPCCVADTSNVSAACPPAQPPRRPGLGDRLGPYSPECVEGHSPKFVLCEEGLSRGKPQGPSPGPLPASESL